MAIATVPSNRVKRIKGKFFDTETSNKSFIKVANSLKKLGIKNYYFMLEIKDPSLVGIDPFDPNLTMDQISRIMIECTVNMWYYLREVARIPQQGGTPIHYRANRGNIAQAWCMLHGVDSWLCLPRQQGKTESIISVYAWAYSFGTNNSEFIFVNKDQANAKSNLDRVKTQINALPPYLHFKSIIDVDVETGKSKIIKATDNATVMRHPITENKIIIKSQATSHEKALSLARGLTAPFLHFDEPEFTPHIKTIVENSVSTFETASRNARSNGALYGRVFTCTPGDLDTSMGIDSAQILENTAKWTEKMYDMDYDQTKNNCEIAKYVKANSGNDIVYIEYSYKQLGLSEEWLVNIARKIDNPITVKREILLQRIRGSSDSPFEQEQIEYLFNNLRNPIEEVYLLNHFRLDVYKTLDKGKRYLAGVDCSTGVNEDSNAITIIDPANLDVVAEFQCPYIGETLFEKLLISLVQQHLPNLVLCIERNNTGSGIIDHLMHSPIRANLYHDKDRDLVGINSKDNDMVKSMLVKHGQEKKYTGIWTGTQTRPDMMAILIRHMKEYIDKITSRYIIEDISKLIKTSSGKIEAAKGFHDDNVMSWLICLYVYYHGNNLARFGIHKGSEDIQNQNQGMKFVDELDERILPQEVIEYHKKQQQFTEEHDYEAMMRKAIIQSQQQTQKMVKTGVSVDNAYANTPINELGHSVYNTTNIPLDFFDNIN